MQRVCVFIGASTGSNPLYYEAAIALGKYIAAKNITLVYGGANIGLMGELANSVLAYGGDVIGVIPKILSKKEIAHPKLTELYVVDSIHERKKMMADLSDAFIAFPGGLGMLEETMEIWNALKMNLCNKPLGILNINNFFNQLFAFLQNGVEEKFLEKKYYDLITINDDPKQLIDMILSLLTSTVIRGFPL